jgi:hypothetical protein
VVAAAYPELLGSQVPRIEVVPDGDEHPRWQEVREFIARLGIVLDPWQERVLWASLLRRGDAWAAFAVAVCCPRQNGKNAILEVRELVGALLLNEKLIIHSAHLADTSKETFRRLDDLIDANDWLEKQVKHIWRTNGHESIEFTNGNRIRFRTRTRGGGRGFSGSPVIFDEPMFLSEISMGSILPVISAQPDPQIWYTGSAVDQTIHEDGFAFARVRDRALEQSDDRLYYAEWSADVDTPDEVEESSAEDRGVWAATNPALGIRITADYVQAERRELDARTFAVERLGVGDWPPVDGSAFQVIPLERWDALADDPASEGARMSDPVVLAFDVTPDRSMSSVVAAGLREDGAVQIEVVDHRPGTGWLPARLFELIERHQPEIVLCDPMGPAGSIVHLCEQADVQVELVSTGDYAKAFGAFHDAVDERTIRHLGGSDLRSAIRGGSKRPLGDGAFGWGRRNSTVDISPLVAATLAHWGWQAQNWTGEVSIF